MSEQTKDPTETAISDIRAERAARLIDRGMHPDAFLPDLATSLENLSLFLTDTGDHDAANATAREVAEIHRVLQAEDP